MDGREVCVCYFVEILGQGQPKISRHLAYLRNAGLVRSRRQGKWMHYSIQLPANVAGRSTLESVLAALKNDKSMQADLTRLTRACCTPQKFVTLEHAPIPTPKN